MRRLIARLFGRGKRVIPPFVSIGEGCSIADSVALMRHHGTIVIGDKVSIFRNGEILAPVTIGSGTFINRDAYIRAETVIGRNVNIGPFVRLVTDTHEMSSVGRRAGDNVFKPIVVEDGVWIGAGALVIGGVTLGRGCVIAAGSVVVSDVPPDCIYGGTPARLIRELEPLADESLPEPMPEPLAA